MRTARIITTANAMLCAWGRGVAMALRRKPAPRLPSRLGTTPGRGTMEIEATVTTKRRDVAAIGAMTALLEDMDRRRVDRSAGSVAAMWGRSSSAARCATSLLTDLGGSAFGIGSIGHRGVGELILGLCHRYLCLARELVAFEPT